MTSTPDAQGILAALREAIDDAQQPEHPIGTMIVPPGTDLPGLLEFDDQLMSRIVHRASYDALVAVLVVLDARIEVARHDHVALNHRDVFDQACGSLRPDDVRSMVNTAARLVGTTIPHREH